MNFNVVWRTHLQRIRERKFHERAKLAKDDITPPKGMRPKGHKTPQTTLLRVHRAEVSDS